MPLLAISIVRFVDGTQPGIVACEFFDADQRKHTLIDKVPLFTTLELWTDSEYPQPGEVGCRVLEKFRDEGGRELVRIATLEAADGETEFVVLSSQVVPDLV